METNRQKKIAGVLQKDLADILQSAARDGMKGVVISVTKVMVTADLSQAKAYLSIFPPEKREEIMEGIVANTPMIRHAIALRTKNQLRRMPEMTFLIDDSLDYIDNIDQALKGLEDPIKNPTNGMSKKKTSDPDLKITSVEGKSFHFNDSVRNALMLDKIKAYSKVVEERVFLSYGDKSHVASIKGIDTNFLHVNRLDTAVYFGNWVNYEAKHTVVVGSAIAMALSIGTYDFLEALKIYVPKPGKGYITNPKTAFNQVNAQTVGIFRLTDEIDRKYVYANMALAQDLLNYDEDQISAVEIRLADEEDEQEVQQELKSRLGSGFEVRTRQQLNSVFYKMLNTENLVSYLVFTLVLIIALFNVIGAIVMMIIDKRENLKTLFHLGSEIRDI
ncbi:unnamed protein product, partial [Cyprideis torosa]